MRRITILSAIMVTTSFTTPSGIGAHHPRRPPTRPPHELPDWFEENRVEAQMRMNIVDPNFGLGTPLFTEAPALASHVTDRVGAGDAVLAVTSMLVAQGTPWDVVGFVGNAVGAEMVAELGNRISVSRFPLIKHITALMK